MESRLQHSGSEDSPPNLLEIDEYCGFPHNKEKNFVFNLKIKFYKPTTYVCLVSIYVYL